MCQSAVAGMNGSSSRPHSASIRSSARADVSRLELHKRAVSLSPGVQTSITPRS